jgi:hypothetical protein
MGNVFQEPTASIFRTEQDFLYSENGNRKFLRNACLPGTYIPNYKVSEPNKSAEVVMLMTYNQDEFNQILGHNTSWAFLWIY